MISQREAMRFRKRVSELESLIAKQRKKWSAEYVGGINLGSITMERSFLAGRIEAARLLGHAVVITEENNGVLRVLALPNPREPV